MRPLNAVPAVPLRAIGYIRVSTTREEMISPELQRQAIEDYCIHRGYDLIDVIEDLDATGRHFARVGIQRAISLIEKREADKVIVWKFSRFGRNRKGWAINLDRVEAVGGHLESATEDVDISTSAGRLSRGMLAEFAAFESDRIGEAWKEAHANRLRSGLTGNGGPRFGYLYHRTTVHTHMGLRICPQGCDPGACETAYVQNPETAAIAAEMYARHARGEGFLAIASWLNDLGVPNARGGTWQAGLVRGYMLTGFAAGLLRKHPNPCSCRTPKACPRVIYLPGAHTAILSEEAWKTFRADAERRRRYAPRVESPVYPMAGLVMCGKCGGPMYAASFRQGRVGYLYRCRTYVASKGCEGTWVTRQAVEERVLAGLTGLGTEMQERSERMSVQGARRVRVQTDRESLLRQQQELQKAMTRLTVDRAKKLVPAVAYDAAIKELEEEHTELEERLKGLEAESSEAQESPVHLVRDLVERWSTMPVSHQRELLGRLIERVEVHRLGRGRHEMKVVTRWGEEAIV